MDILSDVNVVGNIKVTGETTLGKYITINKSLAIFSPVEGITNFYTVDKNGDLMQNPAITIMRTSNGKTYMMMANCGTIDVFGKLTAKSFSYFCQEAHFCNVVYNYSTVLFCKGFDVSGDVNISYFENYHNGKIKNSFFNWSHIFGETTTIDVPADCTRFFIGDVQIINDDASLDFLNVDCLADYFVYPNISVYKNNKKVDMDIEIGAYNLPAEDSGAINSFTEVIIGNIKACSSDQQFKVAISPTFQFDN